MYQAGSSGDDVDDELIKELLRMNIQHVFQKLGPAVAFSAIKDEIKAVAHAATTTTDN